jgi:hypothetical protein
MQIKGLSKQTNQFASALPQQNLTEGFCKQKTTPVGSLRLPEAFCLPECPKRKKKKK